MATSPKPTPTPTPASPAKYKLYLLSYMAQNSSNNLGPSVAGGGWIEVGTFERAELDIAIRSITTTDIGSLGGANSGSLIRTVSVQIS